MKRNVVALVAVQGSIARGTRTRDALDYLPYARATWEWWCAKNGAEFVLVDRTEGTGILPGAPPTVQRWFAPREIIEARGPETRVAMVDADTMIRWDTPDFFELAGDSLTAVHAAGPAWVAKSIAAFLHLFPGVELDPGDYFNAGFVIAGEAQLRVFSAFAKFYAQNQAELEAIFRSADLGTDQTPLNLMVRREGEPVRFLGREYNLLHCFGYDRPTRLEFEIEPSPDWTGFERKAFALPNAFAFIETGFVWHFSNTVAARAIVMAETWKRVKDHYR